MPSDSVLLQLLHLRDLGSVQLGDEVAGELEPVLDTERIEAVREQVRAVHAEPAILEYAVALVSETRRPQAVALGASPRGSIFLVEAARAQAFLTGRDYVVPHDLKRVAPAVLRHRLLLTYEAEAENITSEDVVQRIFDTVEVP